MWYQAVTGTAAAAKRPTSPSYQPGESPATATVAGLSPGWQKLFAGPLGMSFQVGAVAA